MSWRLSIAAATGMAIALLASGVRAGEPDGENRLYRTLVDGGEVQFRLVDDDDDDWEDAQEDYEEWLEDERERQEEAYEEHFERRRRDGWGYRGNYNPYPGYYRGWYYTPRYYDHGYNYGYDHGYNYGYGYYPYAQRYYYYRAPGISVEPGRFYFYHPHTGPINVWW